MARRSPLRILDLFSGLGGWSAAFKKGGHQVIHLDNDPRFGAELTMDVLVFAKEPQRYLDKVAEEKGWIENGQEWKPDVILASPDCRGFSVASIGKMWETADPPVPKHDTARLGLKLAQATLDVIEQYPDSFYAIENPRGMLTNVLRSWKGWEPIHITYCRYGMTYQKSSRIWHNIPDLHLRKHCDAHPRKGIVVDEEGVEWAVDSEGRACHHRAERGSRKGIQGVKDAATRSVIPPQLSEQVLRAVLGEDDLPPTQGKDLFTGGDSNSDLEEWL